MAQATITLTVPGATSVLVDWGRSICKAGLGRINARTGGNPANLDPEGNRLPYTEADVDSVTAAQIQKGVEIILQDVAEHMALSWDATDAARAAGDAVRSRDEISEIETSLG